MPRDNRYMYIAHDCFYVCCSDCVGVCGNCCYVTDVVCSDVCPCQLFSSAWMCCLANVCNCDMFSVVNVYLDHLKFCVVCINGRRCVCCS